jgi:hypothetical protein
MGLVALAGIAGGVPAQADGMDQHLGGWHVKANQVAPKQWEVTVRSDEGFSAPVSDHNLKAVGLSFFGRTTPGPLTASNVQGGVVGAPANTAGWAATGGYTALWQVPNAASSPKLDPYRLQADGSNEFRGTFTLSGDASLVNVQFTNGVTNEWVNIDVTSPGSAPPAVTPEPVSLALVLPGLLPLAMTLRRRHDAAASDDEASTG